MLFLWIFGNNVEDEFGSFRFLIFYLLCGIVAGLVHYASDPASMIPTRRSIRRDLGRPRRLCVPLPEGSNPHPVFLIFYISVIPIPALLWVGIWFAIQLLQGIASKGAGGGVAWFAHIGGLIAGVVLLPIFRPRRRVSRIEPFGGLD